jgi:hypothetical protein
MDDLIMPEAIKVEDVKVESKVEDMIMSAPVIEEKKEEVKIEENDDLNQIIESTIKKLDLRK